MIKTIWRATNATLTFLKDTTVYFICPECGQDSDVLDDTGKSLGRIAKDVHNVSEVLTKEAWPEVNKTMASFKQALGRVENTSSFVTQEAWPAVNQSMAKLNEAIDNTYKASQLIANTVWPRLNETMATFNKTMNKVDAASDIVRHNYWPQVNKTMTNLNRVLDQVYNTMTNESSEVKEKISNIDTSMVQFVFTFLGLCLALAGVLMAANQVKRILASRNHPNASCTSILHCFIESIILYVVYWLSLALALILVFSVFALALQNLVVNNLEHLQIFEKGFVTVIPKYFDLDSSSIITPLLFLVLVMLISWKWALVIAYTKYLVQLPFRLVMDPPHALYNRHRRNDRSNVKADLCLAIHCLVLYTLIGVPCAYLIQKSSYVELTMPHRGIGFIVILFYVIALLAYALGTIINLILTWLTGNREGGNVSQGVGKWVESMDGIWTTSTRKMMEEMRPVSRRRFGYDIIQNRL